MYKDTKIWQSICLAEAKATSFLLCVCTSILSHVQFFVTPWTIAHQAPLSMGFSRQEYWSGLPIPSPGDLPNPGIEPASLALVGRFSTNSTTWEAPKATCV